MPLVLTQNEVTESGHEYADVLGAEYEFPTRYRKLVTPETRFVYYRGRRKEGGGIQPQVYLGAGRIGEVRPSSTPGRLVCQINDFEAFVPPVPFKVEGQYLEADAQPMGKRAGLYFRQGVRVIDATALRRICALAKTG